MSSSFSCEPPASCDICRHAIHLKRSKLAAPDQSSTNIQLLLQCVQHLHSDLSVFALLNTESCLLQLLGLRWYSMTMVSSNSTMILWTACAFKLSITVTDAHARVISAWF